MVTSADAVSAAPAAALGRVGLDDARDDAVDQEEQDRLYPLVVPGLEFLDLRQRGDRRPEGQLVLQRLESGDTLQIFHLPVEIQPASLEAADPADRELVLQLANGWIVMRAPVEELELLALMEGLLGER